MNSLSKEDRRKFGIFRKFLYKNHSEDVKKILQAENSLDHYFVTVNAMELFDASVEFAESLMHEPRKVLPLMDLAVRDVVEEIIIVSEEPDKLSRKLHIHIRMIEFPDFLFMKTIPRTNELGKFLCLLGTVIKTTEPKALVYRKEYMCMKCNHCFTVQTDVQFHNNFITPLVCPGPEGCTGSKFKPLDKDRDPVNIRDYQEVRVQERVQNLVVGVIPSAIWIVLEDDLVDKCKPGQDVLISGVVKQRWSPLVPGKRPSTEIMLHAHNVELLKDQISIKTLSPETIKEFDNFWADLELSPLAKRNMVLASICPQVYGLYLVKLAVALVLAGGIQKEDSSGTRIRGESHLLLVGDPGTGKSQFLKFAAKICSRSVLTTGVGTTSAGLTVTAVKSGGSWQLLAGALVLADGGICCIDEFNSVREQDRASIHEAMEQQTISVAKAGIVCKLNTRCSIIAAANPKGSCSSDENLSVNIAIASPLLSRFDLILILQDTHDAAWDKMVSTHLLKGLDLQDESNQECVWNVSKLRAYFTVIRKITPEITNDCVRTIIQTYYQHMRSNSQRSAARTTVRLLESLVRLSQAHARLMYRAEVTVQDAVMAISLMEASMYGLGLFDKVDILHFCFPTDPENLYRNQVKLVLQRLGLDNILEKELKTLSGGKHGSRTTLLGSISTAVQGNQSQHISAKKSSTQCNSSSPQKNPRNQGTIVQSPKIPPSSKSKSNSFQEETDSAADFNFDFQENVFEKSTSAESIKKKGDSKEKEAVQEPTHDKEELNEQDMFESPHSKSETSQKINLSKKSNDSSAHKSSSHAEENNSVPTELPNSDSTLKPDILKKIENFKYIKSNKRAVPGELNHLNIAPNSNGKIPETKKRKSFEISPPSPSISRFMEPETVINRNDDSDTSRDIKTVLEKNVTTEDKSTNKQTINFLGNDNGVNSEQKARDDSTHATKRQDIQDADKACINKVVKITKPSQQHKWDLTLDTDFPDIDDDNFLCFEKFCNDTPKNIKHRGAAEHRKTNNSFTSTTRELGTCEEVSSNPDETESNSRTLKSVNLGPSEDKKISVMKKLSKFSFIPRCDQDTSKRNSSLNELTESDICNISFNFKRKKL